MNITLIDGPIGTVLIERGFSAPAPAWSAACLSEAPDAVAALHKEYAQAGATHHTANTFRTRRNSLGQAWEQQTRVALNIARDATPDQHTILGSMAPLSDCYRPDLSPDNPYPAHKEFADVLVNHGANILLCETFPHISEGLKAAEAALSTGAETWLSYTAGPNADLLSAEAIALGAREAAKMGVSAILVNCVPAKSAHRYIDAISGHGIPFGLYANAGHPRDGIGWETGTDGPKKYAELACRWVDLGATIVGSCCGTGPAHIRKLSAVLNGE